MAKFNGGMRRGGNFERRPERGGFNRNNSNIRRNFDNRRQEDRPRFNDRRGEGRNFNNNRNSRGGRGRGGFLRQNDQIRRGGRGGRGGKPTEEKLNDDLDIYFKRNKDTYKDKLDSDMDNYKNNLNDQ